MGILCAIPTFVCVKSSPNRKLVCFFNGLGAGWVFQHSLLFRFQWHTIYTLFKSSLSKDVHGNYEILYDEEGDTVHRVTPWHRVTGLTESREVIPTVTKAQRGPN